MTSVVDVWRAVDPEARLLAGAPGAAVAADPHRAAQIAPWRRTCRTRTRPRCWWWTPATLQVRSRRPAQALADARLEPAAIMLAGATGFDVG